MTSLETSAPARIGTEEANRTFRALWWLLAFMPVVFAILTWPTERFFTLQDSLRYLSTPIVAIEGLVVVAAMVAGFEPGRSLGSISGWARYALALLVAVAIWTAVAVAPDKLTAGARTLASLIHLLFGFALAYLFATRWAGLANVWASVVVGILGYCLVLALFVPTIPDPDSYNWVYFMLGVTNVRQIGFYSAVGACAAFALAIQADNRRSMLVWSLATAIMLALSFWSGTRSSLVAFVLCLAVAAVSYRALRSWRVVGLAFACLALGMVMGFVHPTPDPLMGPMRVFFAISGAKDNFSSDRLEGWLLTARMIMERPLFGAGESQFRQLFTYWDGAFNHPHNWILQILFQWGFVGGACYFALAARLGLKFHNAARAMGTRSLPAYLIVVCLLGYSMIEGTMYHPYPIAMVILATVWVLAKSTPVAGEDIDQAASRQGVSR